MCVCLRFKSWPFPSLQGLICFSFVPFCQAVIVWACSSESSNAFKALTTKKPLFLPPMPPQAIPAFGKLSGAATDGRNGDSPRMSRVRTMQMSARQKLGEVKDAADRQVRPWAALWGVVHVRVAASLPLWCGTETLAGEAFWFTCQCLCPVALCCIEDCDCIAGEFRPYEQQVVLSKAACPPVPSASPD